jgi:Flp pilus assembly protein TadG
MRRPRPVTIVLRSWSACLHRRLAPLPRAVRGAAAVEMAFMAPILVFLAAGLIDFGLGIYTKMIVADAAQAGAAYAQLNAKIYSQTPCASNTGTVCVWDTNVQAAAVKSHGAATPFSSAVAATSTVLFCCIVNSVVDRANCTQPPTSAPSCTPTAGTYTEVQASATYTTLLPYNSVGKLLNFSIASPIALTSIDLVRVQ